MRKTKTIALLLALIALIAIAPANTAVAQPQNAVTVIVDGSEVDFPDAPAYIDQNGRTQVPARFIGEALGASVDWNPVTRTADFSRRSTIPGDDLITYVSFRIGSASYTVRTGRSGTLQQLTMDTAAVLDQNRTYVPVRYLAESFDAVVEWLESTRTVKITSPGYVDGSGGEPSARYDHRGLLKAEHAHGYYERWLDSLRITYEGSKVFLSYTVPNDLPEDTTLGISLSTNENEKANGVWWLYYSHEIVAGHRQEGRDYLLPNPVGGGDVRKELPYIPLEGIEYITIGCTIVTPFDTLIDNATECAQTYLNVWLWPNVGEPGRSYISYRDWRHNTSNREIDDIYLGSSDISPFSIIIR